MDPIANELLLGRFLNEEWTALGVDVIVREIDDAALAAGRARLERSLARALSKGKLSEEAVEAAFGRLRYTTDMGELADRQLILEAVSESEALKLDVFATLDKVVADDAILASNTSAIPIMTRGRRHSDFRQPDLDDVAHRRWERAPQGSLGRHRHES